jgi:endonuclease/exonuclease/phosphatase family metal-dependent hydrolase
MAETSENIVVASHNVMHGLRLPALLAHYRALADRPGLDLLCLQEDRLLESGDGRRPSAAIAGALGGSYQALRDDGCPGLAVVIDSRKLACEAMAVVPLPRLASLSWFERLYVIGGKTKQKYVLIADLRTRATGVGFAAVCFHLDTAGGNRHRLAQVEAIALALEQRGFHRRFVACGDTNAFAWRRQGEALGRLLAPLAAFGAADCEMPQETARRPTHYFARQNEGKLVHRTGVLLGKLGLDLPLPYDVVCTNLPVVRRGQVDTPDSDHDLVWARVSI